MSKPLNESAGTAARDALDADTAIVRRVEIGADHPAFEGHFPGRPVLPGVALVATVLEAALADPVLAARAGGVVGIEVVKFLAPVEPGARLAIRFERSGEKGAARIDFVVRTDGGRVAASGRFACHSAVPTAPRSP